MKDIELNGKKMENHNKHEQILSNTSLQNEDMWP